MQQIDKGTLIVPLYYNDYFYPTVLIEKNKYDSTRPDKAPIPFGDFAITGTFKYNNIYGSTNNVVKIKRLE